MSKKLEFIKFISEQIDENQMPENVKIYWEAFKSSDMNEKPLFTENGALILEFLQNHPDEKMWKAKDIAENLGIASRAVGGSIRKLVSDGFVEKLGQNPTIYSITEQGKNINVKGENE